MSNTITTTDEGDHDRDHRLHEAIMLSTKQIVESQQASTTAITAAMEGLQNCGILRMCY
ncbi:hypothetical protein MKX03_002686 [Papaver bracteatum]|nr:hypothetical protein MKX03_002686 [Papaver bracteatum]